MLREERGSRHGALEAVDELLPCDAEGVVLWRIEVDGEIAGDDFERVLGECRQGKRLGDLLGKLETDDQIARVLMCQMER